MLQILSKYNLNRAPPCFTKLIINSFSTKNASKLTKSNVIRGGQIQNNVIGEKIKQTTKDITYFSIVAIGFGVTGILFYVIGKELLSKNTPTAIYSRAFDLVKLEPKVLDLLGPPIKAFGEESGRGRRRNISHTLYEIDGIKHIRMKFYVKGTRKQATIYLEASENSNHNFDFRRMVLQTSGFPERVIDILPEKMKIEEEENYII